MDWQSLLSPWTIGGGLFGLVLALAALLGLLAARRQIGAAVRQATQRLFSPVGFFGLVIVVFLLVSVLESGEFFNVGITHGAIFGLLGYALALGFDLVSVVCMQARLNATRIKDERGARLHLIGVCLCAAVSAFANAAGSLQGYDPVTLDRTPTWMRLSAPWFGMVFPALIILLSLTADHILDHTPTNGIDVDAFRARERKRVEMLQVRLETERELLTLETELSSLRRTREQASGRVPREWVFWRWLRPVAPQPPRLVSDDLKTEIAQTRAALQAPFTDLLTGMHTLTTWSATVETHLHTLHTQMNALQEHMLKGYAQPLQGTRANARTPDQPTREHEPGGGEPGQGGERILATIQELGARATDTQVARASGYSRTTVARWRKRFEAQGILAAAEEGVPQAVASLEKRSEQPEDETPHE